MTDRSGNKERFLQIWKDHTAGETYSSIARRVGLTPQRIRDICLDVERRRGGEWYWDLTERATNAIANAYLFPWDDSKLATLIAMIETGDLLKVKNCGIKTVNEIRAVLVAHGMWVATNSNKTDAYEILAHQYAPC